MRDIAQKGLFGTILLPKDSELESIVRKRRDTHTKLKAPAAKFLLRALRIVVKLAHAKAHDMAMKRAILAVKYTNARQIIIAAQTRM